MTKSRFDFPIMNGPGAIVPGVTVLPKYPAAKQVRNLPNLLGGHSR